MKTATVVLLFILDLKS